MANRYGLQIRAATGADAVAIAELFALCGTTVPMSALSARLDAVRAGAGAALLALEWGPPSGLVALHWAPTLTDDRPLAVLTMLLVAPDERRRGIGRLLLKAASQVARTAGCEALRIAVADDAPALRAFCEATGFETAGSQFVRPLRRRG